jgi:hypothetical protein
MWAINLLIQYPARLFLVGQAGGILVGLVQPWSEKYKGYYPIIFAIDTVFMLVALLFSGGVMGCAEMHRILTLSPVAPHHFAHHMVNLRTLLIGGPIICVAIFHIFSTLAVAREKGLLRVAFLEVIQFVVVLPATLLWSDEIVDARPRCLSLVLASLVVMYFLNEIITTMAEPYHSHGSLLNKPMLLAYVVFASCSRFIPQDILTVLVPAYALFSVLTAAVFVHCIFTTVQARLGIAAIFRVPAGTKEVNIVKPSGTTTLPEKDLEMSAQASALTPCAHKTEDSEKMPFL